MTKGFRPKPQNKKLEELIEIQTKGVALACGVLISERHIQIKADDLKLKIQKVFAENLTEIMAEWRSWEQARLSPGWLQKAFSIQAIELAMKVLDIPKGGENETPRTENL